MKKVLGAVLGLAVVALASYGILNVERARSANLPLSSGPGCAEASQLQSCLNQLIQAINSGGASGVNPNTMGAWLTPRNLVDNGAMQVQQRGTGIQTGQINAAAVASANYAADRWFTSANVAVGAPRGQVTTSTPTPPIGFANSMRVYRNSGALLQPVCAWQVIPTWKAQSLQGQQVVFSAYIQALAGLATDQGAASQVVNMVILTGTSADEGLGTWTASPAITPAWTGLATLQSTAQALPSTAAWARYQNASILVPTTVNEIAVGLCFTPTATGAGTTDGFAFTGVQLEQGSTASPYEFRTPAAEISEAQRYFYRIVESATVINIRAPCAMSTTSIANCLIPFPTTMRVVPTMTYTAGFQASATTASTSATVCTALTTTATLTSQSASTQGVLVDCASGAGFGAAGTAGWLWDLGTGSSTGIINASADF